MIVVKWILLAVLSFLLGVTLLKYLTVHPLQMSLYLVLTCALVFAILVVLVKAFSGRQLLAAILLTMVLFLAG